MIKKVSFSLLFTFWLLLMLKTSGTGGNELGFPRMVEIKGPLGGIVRQKVSSPLALESLKTTVGIIRDKNSNPKTLNVLPQLCPRVTPSPLAIYHGERDSINHTPSFQLFDPDARQGRNRKTYTEMDGRNVLLLKEVEITNDYEDSRIIDYIGPNPLTGKKEIVHEGESGFYANLHYAIIPYDPKILDMNPQTLLHLAEGKLKEIDHDEWTPELRTHSFIPGPFLSKVSPAYEMCEWGDTAYQAPLQKLFYEEIALWDWDYSVKSADHVLMIVWEGDEEDWLIQQQLIDPFYLTDDFIGIFDIQRSNTLTPLSLSNAKGDFKMTVQTGDLTFRPR